MSAEVCTSEISQHTMELEAEVTCSICLEVYKEPLILPCSHTYCKACLHDLVQRGTSGNKLVCPECRHEDVLGAEGVQGYPRNRALGNIIQKLDEQRQKPVSSSGKCAQHNKELEVFCDQCEEMICVWCAVTGEHKGHSVLTVDEACKKYKVHVLHIL
jgi:hypothetical protein